MADGGRSALISGVTGQDGILLSRFLLDQGYEVWGIAREGSPQIRLLQEVCPEVLLLHGDIREQSSIVRALGQSGPDEFYNLAAFSSVGRSWDAAELVMETNALALVGILDGVRDYREETGQEVRFYQASSSEMFGAPAESPQTEQTAFRPRSPYGVAKSAAHFLTINYRESYGLFACSGILYNHESSLRDPHFVTRKIAMSVAAIAAGASDGFSLGRIDVSRDWGFAPDYVRGMWLMLQQPDPDDYILATGRSHTVKEFVDRAFACVGIEEWDRYVTYDKDLERPAEVSHLVGDASKARARLGWEPTFSFDEIVSHMVEEDLKLLRT